MTSAPSEITAIDADLMAEVEASETPPPALEPPLPQPVLKQRGRVLLAFFALVLGGVLAAGAGFVFVRFFPDLLAAPVEEIEELKLQIAAISASDASLADRLSSVESDLVKLDDRLEAVESRPASVGDPAPTEPLKTLQNDGAAIGTSLAQSEVITPDVEAAEARLKQVEERAVASIRRTVALARIASALDTGAPFSLVVDDLPDLPPALADYAATGLPSIVQLREAFLPVAREALEAALRANMGESWTERVSFFLRSQTGLRLITPRDGNDPDAILSRSEAALVQGNVAAVLTELEALPEAAKLPLKNWIAQAKLRIDGEAALVQLVGAQ